MSTFSVHNLRVLGGNTITGKPKRLHRVDVGTRLDPRKVDNPPSFTIALCLGLRGEVYWRVLRHREFVTKRLSTTVPDLQRLERMDGSEWASGLKMRFVDDLVQIGRGREYYGACPAEDVRAAVAAFLAAPIVQQHAGLFRVDLELAGPLDLAIMLDVDGEIFVRLFSPADDQTTSEFASPKYRITIGDLMDFADGTRAIFAPPLHVYRAGGFCFAREEKLNRGNCPAEAARRAARAFLDSRIVQEFAAQA